MKQHILIKPLNAILPAGSVMSVLTTFERISSVALNTDWRSSVTVTASDKIVQTARLFLDPHSAELLSLSGFEIKTLVAAPEAPAAKVVEEDEEEKPAKRGRKKKVVVEAVEEEEETSSADAPYPHYFVDIPIVGFNLEDRQYSITEDEAFIDAMRDADRKETLEKTLRIHEKNIIEYGEPAPLPSAVEEDDIEDALTATPSLNNDMMTANHQAFRAKQEELRGKIEKRYRVLGKLVGRSESTVLTLDEASALASENGVEFENTGFEADIRNIVVGFDF